jgi:glycosyltransferase involved in cell wall biosynthesis
MKSSSVCSGTAGIAVRVNGTDSAPFSTDPKLSLVLPCFNEEQNIEQTIRLAQKWFGDAGIDGEIIVTDDGSADGSAALLQHLQGDMSNLKLVWHDYNHGYGAAIRSGCDAAEKTWIAFMDSDGQFHPSDIALLLPLTQTADFITGIRQKRADDFHRKLNSLLYSLLVRVILGVKPTDLNCGMKLFRRSLWPAIRPTYATGALFNGEMFFALKKARIAWDEIPVPHYPRVAGKSTGANLDVILRTFKELWQLKYSRKPQNIEMRSMVGTAPAAETMRLRPPGPKAA